MFMCEICGDSLPTKKGLSSHVVKKHKIMFKEYYDMYLKSEAEGFCISCKTPTGYIRGKGYARFCCNRKCSSNFNKDLVSHKVKNSEYHLNIKGKSFEDIRGVGSKNVLSNKMKGTFSVEWFISKYGHDVGVEKYIERCKHISKTNHFKEYNKVNKNNYSKMSQELFDKIYSYINFKDEKVYYATLNHEYSCGTEFNFDFVCVDRKKVIEFNGDLFHANPKLFSENDYPNPYIKDLPSYMIWEKDRLKNDKAKTNGFDVLVVWENDYINTPYDVINECIKFLI